MHRSFRPTPKITNHAAKNRDLGLAIGGAIFGCTRETYKECTTGFVFGLPASNWHWVQHVQTGMPIFLFNYNDKMMHGIFRAVMPGTQNINPQGWTSITHTSITRYPAQVKVEWFEKCRPIVDRDFKRAIEGAFFTDKQFNYQLTKDEARRLCEMFSKAATKRLYEVIPELISYVVQGNSSGPPPKSVRQNSQPSSSMAPAAPNPPEVPPTKRPSPSSSTGSSELQRAQEAHHETVDGWDPEPAGSADSAMEQSDPQHPGRATQSDRPATLQASQPPENAWEPRQGTHNAAASAQHPQQMSEQQPEAYRPDIAERQLGHSQQDTDGSAHLETQQRVKAYRRVQGQQQVKPYRPDGAVYRPPPSSSHQPTAATSSAAENSAADASWGDEEDRPLAADTADPQSQELADAAGKIAAGLGDMIDDLPQANSHAATQQAGKEPADEDLSGHQGSMQVGAAEEQHREEEEGMQQGEDEDRGRGKAGAPAGPSDAHRHRHDEEDGVADRDVHMMGTTPPGTSGIQPAAAAISQLTASQQAAKIFLLGGGTSKRDSMWLDAVDVYNPGTQSCTPAAPLPKPCAYGAAATIGQRLFYVGGGNGEDWFQSTLRLSLTDITWEPMADMHEGRGSLFTAMQGYLLWAIGGRNKFAFHESTECYHPAHNIWLMGPAMGRKRFAAAGGVLNNAVYVTGGFDGQSYTNSCERLDPREGKWSLAGSMLTRRGSHACAVQDGQLYAFGGWAAQHPLRECEVYEARLDRWRPVASMHETRAYFAGVACQGALYAMGGLSPSKESDPIYKSTLEVYDPKADSWSVMVPPANFLLERAFMSACVVSQA